MFSRYKERDLYIYGVIVLIGTFLALHNTLFYLAFIFVVPMLLSVITYAYGFTESLMTCVCAAIFSALTSFLSNPPDVVPGVINTLTLCIPGIIIGYCFKIKSSYKDIVISTSIYDFILLLTMLAIVKYANKINITDTVHETMFSIYYSQIDIIKSLNTDFAKTIEQNEETILSALYVCIPGLFPFVATVIIVLANTLKFGLCKMSCSAMMMKKENFSDGFDVFKTSVVSVIAFALFAATVLIAESMTAFMIGANAMLVVLFLYYLRGISVTEFKMKQKFVPPVPRLLALTGILIVSLLSATIFPVINIIYVFIFIGVLDAFFDFRKISYNKDEANEE